MNADVAISQLMLAEVWWRNLLGDSTTSSRVGEGEGEGEREELHLFFFSVQLE